jgi:hypothetical protein
VPDEIQCVTHWPSDRGHNRDEERVPTEVDLATMNWGYLVSKDANPVRWFNLLLLSERERKHDMKACGILLNDTREKLQKAKLAVGDLIAVFLQKLWEHTLKEIEDRFGGFDLVPLKVAITVPAIWPPYAMRNLDAAVVKAGILNPRRMGETTLIHVEESKAAAFSTLFGPRNLATIEVCTGAFVEFSYSKKNSNVQHT